MLCVLLSLGFWSSSLFPFEIDTPLDVLVTQLLYGDRLKFVTTYWRDVAGIATGYGLDGPGIESRWGPRFSAPVQTGPGAHPASCTMGTGSFPGVKIGPGVTLTPHPLIVLWSRKGRAIPKLPLWAVRPVQSLSACTRVYFYWRDRYISGLIAYVEV